MTRGVRNGAMGLVAVILVSATGCKVQVDRSGEGDNVKIATPFGSIAVNKDQTTASEVGLPAYPMSTLQSGEDGNKSAKVDMGFGSWKLRVRVAHYSTSDKRDQVVAFYRKALGEYGGVIVCAGDKPVGEPVTTSEGLTCGHSEHEGPHGNFNSGDLELKAGSPRRQHLVVFDKEGDSSTHFTLIALDLPHGESDDGAGTN